MTTEAPWTVGRLRDWTATHLKSKGIDAARLEAELLLAHTLGCSRTDLYVRNGEEPSGADRARFKELIKKRVEGTPVSRLLGKKEFFSLEFEITPDVLVPRPDTEWLVTEALTLLKPVESPEILDVGTGSGCVAVALAKVHKSARVTAIDLSETALAVALRNAEKHKLAERIRFLQGDLFASLVPTERFDAVVSNPPYIPTGDIAGLAAEVRDHDPRAALDGGLDGFAVIDRLLAEAGQHLKAGGHLLCEIGHGQAVEARRRFAAAGWEITRTANDAGGHVRVLVAKRA